MNTSELMIGDYVTVTPSGMLIKIAAVHHKKVAYHTCTNKLAWVRMSLLNPIPLTKEILEKNGLHAIHGRPDFFDEDRTYRVELTLGTDGTTRWTINFDEYDIISLNYVHQLQHVLRLCEIEKEIVL